MNDLVTVHRLRENEEQFLNAIVESGGANLPNAVEDVLPVFEFTDWKAKAWKILSDKLSRLDDQQEAYHSALRSGQNWGIAALYAQKRMGEITREMPKTRETDDGTVVGRNVAPKANVPYHSWNDAERIASYPDVLDSVIEKSKQSDEIPTKTAVLREIKNRRYSEKHPKPQQEKPDVNKVASEVYEKLTDCYAKLTAIWPHVDSLSDFNRVGIQEVAERICALVREGNDDI